MSRNTSLFVGSLLGVAMACAAVAPAAQKAPAQGKPSVPPAVSTKTNKTIVYYFHGTNRCATCRKIEAQADEAVKAAFATELKSGDIQWKPVNIDEAAHRHFVEDYQLVTRSLVVVDAADSKRFKNLDKVWTLVGQKDTFLKYVQDEIRAFRKS